MCAERLRMQRVDPIGQFSEQPRKRKPAGETAGFPDR